MSKDINVAAIAVIPKDGYFLGIECTKGRGLIFPGGGYESDKDESFHYTAKREAYEEVGIDIDLDYMRLICCLPDGKNHMVYAFWCPEWTGTPIPTKEGSPRLVSWPDLLKNKRYKPYYSALYDIMKGQFYES